jgi:flagellar M-ring protein FliF
VRAEATVEMDFDRVETREERFDPENQVARSTQSVTEQNRGAETPPTSVATNLPGQEATGGGGGSSENRQEETTNFEIGRSSRSTLREHPVVKRLSVAVLVDGLAEGGAWRERTPEELARIASLVRSAVGFDERRGDKVEVVSMRFVEEAQGPAGPPGFLGLPIAPALATRLIESGLLAVVALVAILLLGRPVIGRVAASLAPAAPALAEGAEGDASLEGGEAGRLPGSETMIDRAQIEGQLRASAINNLLELVEQHPDEALSVLRRWLTPEEPG